MKNTHEIEMKPKINVGIINLMPKPHVYHQELLQALAPLELEVHFHWIRLSTKDYDKTDMPFLDEQYKTFDAVHQSIGLDAVILSGAPVELLVFDAISYWPELKQILTQVISERLTTLGICWGALAIANVLGVNKESLERKAFGVFHSRPGPQYSERDDAVPYYMPFSIQAQLNPEQVKQKIIDGDFKVIAHFDGLENAILTTQCDRHTMCLGHPEYGPNRLVDEWNRDRKKMPLMSKPIGVDVEQPNEIWRTDSNNFFIHWLSQLKQQKNGLWEPLSKGNGSTMIKTEQNMEETLYE